MSDTVRIDRWLWAARFYKTRGLAKQAIDGGKVDLNGHRAKPSKALKVGDVVRFSRGDLRTECEVLALSEKRLGAALAAELYCETQESVAAREAFVEARRLRNEQRIGPARRPDKHARKRLAELKKQ